LLNGSLVTSQIAGTQGWDGASTELTASTTALTGGETVNSVSVGGSQQNMGYQITAQSTQGDTITLTQVNSTGQTTGLTQTLNLANIAAGQAEELNFSDFGVKLTLGNNTANTITAATYSADFATGLSIDAGTGSAVATLQTGANEGDVTSVQFMSTRLTGATGNASMDGLKQALDTFNTTASADNASSLITAVDNALNSISSNRATLGAAQNRLNYTISNLGTASENLQQANSRIMDVDVATESSDMAKEQVLEQAGVSVLAQANQLPQLALKLLA
jgi:flagellin